VSAMTKTITKTVTVPDSLADVALADAYTCAAVGDMGITWWLDKVASGEAPAPVIRQPRCTRWRIADVKNFYAQLASQKLDKSPAMTAHAAKASKAARAKREAAKAATAGA
jgi:hypothetical protein